MRASCLVAVGLAMLSACGRTNAATLDIVFPPGARQATVRLEIHIYPGRIAEPIFQDALRQSCEEACDNGAITLEAAPQVLGPFLPDANGNFSIPEVELDADAPWGAVVVARSTNDPNGGVVVFGAANLIPDDTARVELEHTWCEDRTCPFFTSFCEVDCAATIVNARRSPADPPRCAQARTRWAQSLGPDGEAGVTCPPTSGSYPAGATCRPEAFDCTTENGFFPAVCPAASEETVCDADTPLPPDTRCDGPLDVCGNCRDGETADCSSGECRGTRQCMNGVFQRCMFTPRPGVVERCNGQDDNCDGQVDETGFAECTGYRTPDAPAATACAGGNCLCGEGRECAFPQVCCDGRCVNARTDENNCGGCGIRCEGQVCSNFACQDAFVALICRADVLTVCNRLRALGFERADRCTNQQCACGPGPACGPRQMCCLGECMPVTPDGCADG